MIYFGSVLSLCVIIVMMDTFQCNKKLKQSFYGISVMAFILLATFRSFEFQDTIPYRDFFVSQIGVGLFAPKQTQFEWGFVVLTRLCTILSGDYRVLFFVQALIVNLIAVIILKKSDSKMLLYACFLSFYGIYTTFIILRSGLAIAFFALGVIRFDKSWCGKILCFAIAMLFHTSAIVMMVVWLFAYFLKRINLKAEYACGILIVFLILFASGITKEILLLIKDGLQSIPLKSYYIAKAIEYIQYNIEIFEFGLSFRYLLNALVFLLALFTINQDNIQLFAVMKANLMFIFLGLCMESLFGNMRLIGRLTDFSNILNIGSIGIIIKNNISKIKHYETIGCKNSICIGKIRGIQLYSFAVAMIFISMNLVFMYRIVY